jgi:DNA-binding XRE family transcriptional regulator
MTIARLILHSSGVDRRRLLLTGHLRFLLVVEAPRTALGERGTQPVSVGCLACRECQLSVPRPRPCKRRGGTIVSGDGNDTPWIFARQSATLQTMPKGKPPTSAQMALGDAMRAIREEQGTSQERLALTAGIDRSYFSAIERGEFNVTLGVLLKVASALGVPAWKLLKRAKL